jgi:ParB family chromosome partitioning protein
LNPLEVALGYQRLLDEFQYTQEQVSDRVGKKRSTVANMLRLLQLPPFLQAAIRDELITAGHARALLTIDEVSLQEKMLKRIVNQSLSVREVERMVQQLKLSEDKRPIRKSPLPVYIRNFSDRLRQALGTRVQLQPKAKGGEIRIQYASNEELERIIEILDPEE